MKLFIHKLTHWEYWPYQVVYFPIYFLWLYYALRARSFFFFNAVNPAMRNGGFFNTGKKEIYDLIPPSYYPKTWLIEPSKNIPLQQFLGGEKLAFPLIVKPNKGLRGILVKKIADWQSLKQYHQEAHFDYLIQALSPYSEEVGIFYVRKPNERIGKITSIVSKKFLTVVGDGCSTIVNLIEQTPRYAMQLATLQATSQEDLTHILPEGQCLTLVPIGNHNRGTMFLDANDRISPALNRTINKICENIEGFYYGRLDIRYNHWHDLEQGINFDIIEINGAMSEPAHIYDPRHGYLFALKEIITHFNWMLDISQINRKMGVSYLSFRQGIKELQEHYQNLDTFKTQKRTYA